MRAMLVTALLAGAFGLASASIGSATPGGGATVAQAAQQLDQMRQIKQGCGRGFHLNRHGRCVRNKP
jgi:hypothetical protein